VVAAAQGGRWGGFVTSDPSQLSDEALREYLTTREWYHTIELRPGVETPGWFDTRGVAGRLPWPDLTGKRCLDVGTFDGFWAHEMVRRGAKEVVTVDVIDPRVWDWPAGSSEELVATLAARKRQGDGFESVCNVLGTPLARHELSVYDLDPSIVGDFDVVYVGSLLLHLRDPVKALERVATVCRPDGRLLLVDAIDLELTVRHPRRAVAELDGKGRPWWWKPNVAGLERMLSSGGFDQIGKTQRLYMPPGAGQPLPRAKLSMLRTVEGRETLVTKRQGNPHAAILAKPR
jgi:tRNA (mo5U34)-methyltransferase